MASLRKKSSSKFWFACFNLPGGGRTQRSTKTTDRRLAQKLADQFEEAASIRQTEAQALRVMGDIRMKITGKRTGSQRIRNYLEQWSEARRGTVSPATLIAYRNAVNDFVEFLGAGADEEMVFLGTEEFVRFRDTVSANLSPQSANKKLKIIRVAFQQAWRDGVVEQNPAAKVQTLRVKGEDGGRRAFTLAELRRILEFASPEWQGLILFGLYTGQRLGDLVRLTWTNLNIERQTVELTTRKTGRRQILPLAAPLRKWLHGANVGPRNSPLFPTLFALLGVAGHVSTLSNQFRDLMAQAGIVEKSRHAKKPEGKGRDSRRAVSELSFHSLRHTATSLMKNAGVSPALVQEFIGHDSKVVSQNYTHIETDALRKAADALPDLLDG